MKMHPHILRCRRSGLGRRHARPAFTLVEVMLAIAIFSVVMGAMYATWRAIIGAAKSSQYAAAQTQRVRIALWSLEQSLTYARKHAANSPRYYIFDPGNGSDDPLRFVSYLPEDFPRNGRFGGTPVRHLEYSLRSGSDGGKELVLRQRLITHEDFDTDEREYPLVLMKHIKGWEVECWDVQKQDWTDQWKNTNQIPRKIRIAITTLNPKNTYDRGDEYTILVSPASVDVQAAWQGGGAVPGTQLPGTQGTR